MTSRVLDRATRTDALLYVPVPFHLSIGLLHQTTPTKCLSPQWSASASASPSVSPPQQPYTSTHSPPSGLHRCNASTPRRSPGPTHRQTQTTAGPYMPTIPSCRSRAAHRLLPGHLYLRDSFPRRRCGRLVWEACWGLWRVLGYVRFRRYWLWFWEWGLFLLRYSTQSPEGEERWSVIC